MVVNARITEKTAPPSNPATFPKVMVCCLTYSKRIFVIRELLRCLSDQTYPNLAVVILDTTPANGKSYPELPMIVDELLPHATILSTSSSSFIPPQIVADGREVLRRHFIDSDADYLFFIDDDTILPPHAIATLLHHGVDAAVGIYIVNAAINGKDGYSVSCWFESPSSDDSLAVTSLSIADAMPDKVMDVDLSGLGCALLSRRAVQDTTFVYKKPISEDFLFFRDLRKKGFRILCDTSVKCTHKRFPPGDKRNIPFDFRTYIA